MDADFGGCLGGRKKVIGGPLVAPERRRRFGRPPGRAAEECADGPTKEKERKIKRRKGKGFFLVLNIAL